MTAEFDSGEGKRGGLFDSLRTLTATLLAIGRTRLELLSTELEEEIIWRISMLIWTLVGLFCASVGIVLVTLFFVVLLWDTNRLMALGIPAILFLLGAALSWRFVLTKARTKPRLFSDSLAEFAKDRDHLTPRT
jgi:uncharacterized membrane protein YqjE